MIDEFLGKLVADKYRVESLVREGEMGDLYSARHEIMDKPVTMKILPAALAVDARWTKRFIDEARTASGISHANILNLTDFGTDSKGVAYAVFEHTGGKTLRDLMSDPFDEKNALVITRDIVAGVRAAHAKKIIHADISPRNVFVDAVGDEQSIKVIGFVSDPQKVARDAEPQYLAPEQLTAFPTADERSDVYALGIMFYEMLSGVVPFDGATAAEVSAKQGTEPPPLSVFRRDLHPEIEPIILTAIAAEPERRYQTVEAFAEDLEILAGRVGSPTAAATAAASVAKRNVRQTAFIALAGISLLAAALIYATSVKSTDPTAQMQVDAASLPVQPIGPATGALEDNLAKQGPMSALETEMLANSNAAVMDMLPGGDGYNAWANGGMPPAGGPPTTGVPPPGGTVTIPGGSEIVSDGVFYDADNNRCFKGTEVVLCPWAAKEPEKPASNSDNKKPPPVNANVAIPKPTPAKPLATPLPKTTNDEAAKDNPSSKKPNRPAKPEE